VLILSEFAGAAQSLGAGAILVNPWNITDMAAAIEDALTMSDQARARPHLLVLALGVALPPGSRARGALERAGEC
jgi:trehalose-6-phosphate synthase